jgi:hypothetical protein
MAISTIVSYNGSRLIPAPFVNITKSLQKTGDDRKLGTAYTIVLTGYLVSDMGSPDKDGDLHTSTSTNPADETVDSNAKLAAGERKMEALRKLFADEGKELKIQSQNDAQALTCNPKVVSIEFPSEIWFQYIRYTITLEADVVYGLTSLNDERFSQYIQEATENWDIQEGDIPLTFNVTHTLNVVGKRFYSSSGTVDYQPWEYARQYAQTIVGNDNQKFFDSLMGRDGSGGSGLVSFSGYTPYNFRRNESVDEFGGAYQLTESWLYATGTAIEDYSIRVTHTNEDTTRTLIANLEGSVRGNYEYNNMWNYPGAYTNALSYFNNIVRPSVTDRIWEVASGTYFINKTVSHDRIRGTINYNYDYDNRSSGVGYTEEFSVNQSFDYTNYLTTVTIEGKIAGLLSDSETAKSIKFTKAQSRWTEVQPTLFSRIQTYVTGIDNLRSVPARKNIVHNPDEGSIQYSFEFNNRDRNNITEDFSVTSSYDKNNGITIVGIAGSVQGLDITGTGNIGERYVYALQNMPTDTEVYERALAFATGIDVSNSIITKEIVRAPNAGTISYNYTYSTEKAPCFSGALSENIVVNDDLVGDVFASIFVLGRLRGPVLQSLGAKTARRRTLGVELVMPAFTGVSCDYRGGYSTKPNVATIVAGVVPTGYYQLFEEPGTESWDWRRGRYSFSRSWTYELL